MQILLISCMVGGMPSSPRLTPYNTNSPVTGYGTNTPRPAITQTATATFTPQVYTIAQNDTIYGIARRFDLTPEALIIANPSTMPSSLTIGDTLIIPDGAAANPNLPSFTPIPLDIGDPFCVDQPDGTACFVEVKNTTDSPIENLIIRFTLFDENGQPADQKDGLLLLNLLPTGAVLPASVFFPGQYNPANSSAELVASNHPTLTQQPTSGARILDPQIEFSWDGRTGTVQGSIHIPSEASGEITFWVAAVGYDMDGRINSFRRWEGNRSAAETTNLPFTLELFSLVGKIETVELFLEEIR
jgi:LysM repeat protein